jgi:inosine-uridine nucleoside N-ribohydrolase
MKTWNYKYQVPDQKKVRMIVYTDAKNEADDQFAIAHHLMTPKFIVKGIVAAHFNMAPKEFQAGHTAEASFKEVEKILKLMDLEGAYPLVKGAEYPLVDEKTPQESDGADLIIAEAMKDDPHPLYIGCQGSVTDLASAILKKPEICNRMTAIWIGGGEYPTGGSEFNLDQDRNAARVLMASGMPLWQVPKNVYKQVAVSLAELQYKVASCGEIGDYLFRQMVDVNNKAADFPWPDGEIWGLGDSPTIGLLLQEAEREDVYELRPAPYIRDDDTYDLDTSNREIRVYKEADQRLILEDFFAKLALNYRRN